MDTNQPTANPTYVQARRNNGIFGTGIPSTVAFAIALLLFLLPFTEIKCGGTTIMSKSGFDYALGNDWKVMGGLGGKDTGGDDDMATKANDKKEDKMLQIYIIAAMGLALLGLLFSLGKRSTSSIGIVSGIVGAAALIVFMIGVKKWFNDGLAKQASEKVSEGADSIGMGDMKAVQFAMSTWFYVAVVFLLAGAVFSFLRMRQPRQ